MNRTVAVSVVFLVALVLGSSTPVFSQSADDDAIKAVVRTETAAFYSRDFDAWQAVWLHDSKSTRTLIASGMYVAEVGWDQIGANMQKLFKESPARDKAQFSHENFVLQTSGNMALVQYDQLTEREGSSKQRSRQHRVLLKDNGQWKVFSQVSINTESLSGANSEAIEQSLNGDGYHLMRAGKLKEAIEVFKLNVQFNPQSWNAYDSLGEAYLAAGDKALAVVNYEKSVQLNPKSESGKAALAKLKSQ